jgi:hypothetical protein
MAVWNFTSGMVERYRSRYILYTGTAEGVPKLYYSLLWLTFPLSCQIHIRSYVLMFYLYINKYVVKK